MEGFNGLYQAARARARTNRNAASFITIIDLIGRPAGSILKSTWNDEEPELSHAALDQAPEILVRDFGYRLLARSGELSSILRIR
jgi:hypothetical protein